MVWWEEDQRVYGLNASGRCPEGLSAGRFANRKTIGMGLQQAIDAPRYRVLHGDDVALQDMLDPQTVAELERRGHQRVIGDPPPSDWTSPLSYVRGFKGSAQMIRFHRDHGSLEGATDARLDGVAIGL